MNAEDCIIANHQPSRGAIPGKDRMMNEYYILYRPSEDFQETPFTDDYQIVSVTKGNDPLHGYGSWNLCQGPFTTWNEANEFFDDPIV